MEMRANIVLDAALISDWISRLILLDPGIIDDGNPEFLKYLFFPLTRISAKLFRDSDFRMASFKGSYYKPEQITQADVDAYMVASRTENFVNAMVSMLKNYTDPDELSSVGQVRQPVLLLWGEFDRGNPPENGYILEKEFQNAELHIIPGSGHYIHEEQPEMTSRLILDFLKN
ncbi:alpha/beta fold hydrolase [Spirochaeta isovalerica]|uniref:Pimeloyl-ACP methyl ester carboxylesterase n=1 Tax=Spirochaeta isovalerica TaxID=150 RepID=A0A841RF13_9SPIO|nr:alpha/beta hydrolase [Spirochaeta isovalerica]MBB6481188.1 pimeloyl-ACP methyl ester carboxylesterase [Spirochaeta isovalerica]